MITLNPVSNVHRFDRHLIFISIDSQIEITHRLNNPYALEEANLNPESAATAYRGFLWEQMKRKGSAYKDMVKFAKAARAGQWVEISYAIEQKHAEILARAISYLAETLPAEEQQTPRAKVEAAPVLEPIAGYHVDDDNDHTDEDWRAMYDEGTAPRLQAEDHDLNLFQIAWLTGETQSKLAYMQDDHTAIVPGYGLVNVGALKVRFAKHKIGRLPHVQQSLAEAYNEYYNTNPCDWNLDAELLESAYDPELASRYGTDTEPNSEANYDHSDQPDWIAIAASDSYQGGVISSQAWFVNFKEAFAIDADKPSAERQIVSLAIELEQIDGMKEEFSYGKNDNDLLKVRGIKAQSRGQRFKDYANQQQAQTHARKHGSKIGQPAAKPAPQMPKRPSKQAIFQAELRRLQEEKKAQQARQAQAKALNAKDREILGLPKAA